MTEAGPVQVSFAGGRTGAWHVERISAVAGPPLTAVHRIAVVGGRDFPIPQDSAWVLQGVTSYERYVLRAERSALVARQPPLGRAEATCAALIPIRKSGTWWELTQDERRAIFEERSRHIATGMEYLPAIARRLYHSRDLGQPFDFLTWFEYAPAFAELFEELVRKLRETEEWDYVEREVDIRVTLQDKNPNLAGSEALACRDGATDRPARGLPYPTGYLWDMSAPQSPDEA